MDRNDFENRMKMELQEQEFQPMEERWLKLAADLQGTATTSRKTVFLPWVKMAAAAIAMVSLGTITYYLVKEKDTTNPSVVSNKTEQQPVLPKTSMDEKIAIEKPGLIQSNLNSFAAEKRTEKRSINQPITTITPSNNPAIVTATQTIAKESNSKEDTNLPFPATEENGNNKKQPEFQDDFSYVANNASEHAINVGMIANIGSSTVSNIDYQVGVIGRGHLSKLIFVEAGLSLSANSVNNNSLQSFPSVSFGTNEGMSNVVTTTNVATDYTRNIISVGLTPSLGINATSKLSVSAGGAINRNLNPSLILSNQNDIDNAALDNNIISTTQRISTWDIGVTCNAEYRVTKGLSVNVKYKKGLTDYLQQNNKNIKNSGIQMGLKYLFGN